MIIILLGYMGSGKSTIGNQLASKLNFEFVDLDAYIERKEGIKISDLFSSKGEVYFRKKETTYLNELIENPDNKLVLALGGGTPCYGNNMKLIENTSDTISFYLKGTINTLTERLFTEKENRPLLAHISTKEKLSEFIAKHLFERNTMYSKANYTVEIDDKTQDEICEQLVVSLF